MKFSKGIEEAAFKSHTGEYAWRREDIPAAVTEIAGRHFAILGGEIWIVRNSEIWGVVPQSEGPPRVYHWETERHPREDWSAFASRSASETLDTVQEMPIEAEMALPEGAEIFYNLTWVSEYEYAKLGNGA